MVKSPRGMAKGLEDRIARGPAGAISSTVSILSRVSGVIVIGAGLSACAIGSMGAMMGGGANGVAAISADDAQPVEIAYNPAHEEFTAMAEVIETPVWAALGPLERDRGIFNMGSMVGMLLVGNDNEEEAAPDSSTAQADRYVSSLDSLFDDRNGVAIAMAADIFRKNSESRRFISAANDVIDGHSWSVASINAAFQAGDVDRATYRAHLARLDEDRRVLGGVLSSLQEQRRIFSRARTILVSDNSSPNMARVDEEMASLAQYQEMVARLSATISGEAEVSS